MAIQNRENSKIDFRFTVVVACKIVVLLAAPIAQASNVQGEIKMLPPNDFGGNLHAAGGYFSLMKAVKDSLSINNY